MTEIFGCKGWLTPSQVRLGSLTHPMIFKIWQLSYLRYLDILMGLSMLISLVSLEYGSMSGERAPLALFLILRFLSLPNFQNYISFPRSAWPLSLATGSGSSTSSTSRWRARLQKRWKDFCSLLNQLTMILLFVGSNLKIIGH